MWFYEFVYGPRARVILANVKNVYWIKGLNNSVFFVSRNLDVDRKLHLVVYMESVLPKGLPRYDTAPGGSDHGHMVRAYQLPMRATG